MPVGEGLTWGTTSATVNVGETITVNVTYGMLPTSAGITSNLNGLATAELSGNTVAFTGVSAGTVTIPTGADVGNTCLTTNAFTLTVTSAEDESYLNKRGLAHFWENIDDLKQNKLTAGAGISITGNTISASGVTSFNGLTGAVTYTAPVTSVNGSTGAVTGLQTTSNLVTSVSSSSTNSQYPSAKLFYDTVGNVETILSTLNNGGGAQ